MAGSSGIEYWIPIRTVQMTDDCNGLQEFLQFTIHPHQQVPNNDDRCNILMYSEKWEGDNSMCKDPSPSPYCILSRATMSKSRRYDDST